jgi:hypothetical protein
VEPGAALHGRAGRVRRPLILGLLPWFRRSGPRAALSAVLLGLGVWLVLFVLSKSGVVVSKEQLVAWPILVSAVVYVAGGLLWPERTQDRDELVNALESDEETAVAAK